MQSTTSRINDAKEAFGSSASMSKLESEIADVASGFVDRVKTASNEYAKESVEFVKKYPLHTAVGAVAIGYVVGMLMSRSSK